MDVSRGRKWRRGTLNSGDLEHGDGYGVVDGGSSEVQGVLATTIWFWWSHWGGFGRCTRRWSCARLGAPPLLTP
jgi:hypothetical protein